MTPEKFRNKYRILSARKPDWDYRAPAIYYVTICTQNRVHYFGNIKNGKIILSSIGEIANKHWFDIPYHFPFIELINFVVMPNHIHGLLQIHDNDDNIRNGSGQSTEMSQPADTTQSTVDTLHATSLRGIDQYPNISNATNKNELMSGISPKRGSLPSVLRSYKSAVSKSAHENGFRFAWQPRYHDHIVKNPDEFQRIYDYISNNPRNWEKDNFHF